MISYQAALSMIRESGAARRTALEDVPIEECAGRVAGAPVESAEWIPAFANSAMDGFAVRAADTAAASAASPVRLAVGARVAAGERLEEAVTGGAVEIMTGAPLPGGALDAVVRIEDVRVERGPDGAPKAIELSRPARPRENVRDPGEDFAPGLSVVREGDRLGPEHVMALASLGVAGVRARARPRVAVISTGKELVAHREAPAGALPGRGAIRNSSGPFLVSALTLLGAEASYEGIVRDEPREFLDLLSRILRDPPDAVVSTGAVSMGRHDFVTDAIGAAGARTLFHKSAIRPGKPILFAELPGRAGRPGPVFFGLPGNPVSTAVGLRFFIEPYLREILGAAPERPSRAFLAHDASKAEGFRCFYKARVEEGSGRLGVRILPGQGSHLVRPLLEANAWAVLPEQGRSAPAGTEVEVFSRWA